MATSVTNKEEIILEDDTEVTIKPIVVARLRRAFEAWGEFERAAKANREVDELEVLINVTGICLEHDLKTKVEGNLFSDKPRLKLTKEYREYLEGVLDRETMEKVLLVSAGIDLKSMRETMQAIVAQAGTSST